MFISDLLLRGGGDDLTGFIFYQNLLRNVLNFHQNSFMELQMTAKILMVDDEFDMPQMIAQHFREDVINKKYAFEFAENGREALDILKKDGGKSFDIVLTDINMPEMDGLTLLQHIDDLDSQIVPIVISAYGDMKNIRTAMNRGAYDFILKPIDLDDLSITLEKTFKHVLQIKEVDRLRVENAEMERERFRSLAQMVAGVAHEINTPLGIANTAASIIMGRLRPGEADPGAIGREAIEESIEAARLMQSNIQRASKLIQSFKKLSTRQATESKETVNLPELIDEILSLFSPNARKAKLKIEMQSEIPRGKEYWVGYPGFLTQVLMNLLSNIQNYAYPDGNGGKVDIVLAEAALPEGTGFTITVRDFGKGMSREDLQRIFEPFFTTGRSKGGTGLGMAIVYNLATDALRGEIQIDSTPGEGTSATLTIPASIPDTK